MESKEKIKSLLSDLKKMGFSRRRIESDLGYSKYYLDQVLSLGGNEKVLFALQRYQERLEDQQSVVNDGPAEYISTKQLIEYQKDEISKLRSEKIKLLEEKQELDIKIKRLENQVHMLLEANFKNTTSGKRRRSAS